MKETPLNKAFEDAMRRLDSDPARHHAAEQLAMLQHAVIDFRDAGMEVTLTVRPEGRGFALAREEGDAKPLANGELISGDIRLDFIIQQEGYYEDDMSLKIFRGDEMVMERKSTFDEDSKTWSEVEPESEDEDGAYDDGHDNESPETPLPNDLKFAVTRLLIDLKAQEGFASQFNVGPNGIPGNSVEKPFAVAPPLKLKKPDGP